MQRWKEKEEMVIIQYSANNNRSAKISEYSLNDVWNWRKVIRMYECNKCVQPSKSFSMIDVASSRHSLIWNYIVVPVAYSVSNLWNGSASSLDVREMRTASALINHAIINTVLTCFSFSFFAPSNLFGLFENESTGKRVSRKYSGAISKVI